MRGIAWLVAAALALAGLLGGPRELRAEDFAAVWQENNAKRYALVALLGDERYVEAVPLGEEVVKKGEELYRKLRLDLDHLPKRLSSDQEGAIRFLSDAYANLAIAVMECGDYARSEALLRRALLFADKCEDQAPRYIAIYNLGRVHEQRGEYARAEELFRGAPAVCKKNDTSYWLEGYRFCTEAGRILLAKGDLAGAEPLLLYSFKDKELLHKDTTFRISLGDFYLAKGDFARAEPLYRSALNEVRFTNQAASPMRARALDALARFYVKVREPERASPFYEEAIAVREKGFGPNHPGIAVSLGGLADIRLSAEDLAGAKPLLARAQSLQDKAPGLASKDKAWTLTLLGELHQRTSDLSGAEGYYRRALAMVEQSFGPDHLAVADELIHLGDLAEAQRDLTAAKPLYERAVAIREKRLGATHVGVADPLDRLSEVALLQGKPADALASLERSANLRDRAAVEVFAVGSERQKSAFAASLGRQTDLILSLRAKGSPAPAPPEATQLMLTSVLRRKGRLLDALSDSRAALRDRHTAEDQTLLNELVALQGRIVSLIVNGPGAVPVEEHRKAIAELERQKERLEAEVGRRGAALRTDDPMITVPQVQAVIPDGAALVEMLVHSPLGAAGQASPPPRVLAYVLPSHGDVTEVDLGDAGEIATRVAELREVLSDPARDPRAAARSFYQKVMRPLRAALGQTRWLLLSPDGALNLVPFGALLDDDGRYLVETTGITYLTSGRDLLRYSYNEAPKEPGIRALVMGAPDFGDPKKKRSRFRPEAEVAESRRSVDMSGIRFTPLPGTAVEAKTIGSELPGARVLLGAEATEAALKAVKHPRILHVASHGFFLPDRQAKDPPPEGGLAKATFENPLLRAGVAFASANQPVPGDEDGILTALEASGLDLYGTKLVVLSACETGVGEAKNGDGVYGLRRALVIAGAQTQVMSLWTISDEGTRDLMVAYYKRLAQGEGRSEAMRKVALSMLANPKRAHPYFWASFIVSGDGSTLDGKDAPPEISRHLLVAKGPRGCGCAEVGEGPFDGARERAALLAVALALVAARRRQRAVVT